PANQVLDRVDVDAVIGTAGDSEMAAARADGHDGLGVVRPGVPQCLFVNDVGLFRVEQTEAILLPVIRVDPAHRRDELDLSACASPDRRESQRQIDRVPFALRFSPPRDRLSVARIPDPEDRSPSGALLDEAAREDLLPIRQVNEGRVSLPFVAFLDRIRGNTPEAQFAVASGDGDAGLLDAGPDGPRGPAFRRLALGFGNRLAWRGCDLLVRGYAPQPNIQLFLLRTGDVAPGRGDQSRRVRALHEI